MRKAREIVSAYIEINAHLAEYPIIAEERKRYLKGWLHALEWVMGQGTLPTEILEKYGFKVEKGER